MTPGLPIAFRLIKRPLTSPLNAAHRQGYGLDGAVNKSLVMVVSILALLFSSGEMCFAQNLNITSPVDGACVAGPYTVAEPLEGGIINGNNFAPDPANISFSYVDNSGNFLDVKVTASAVENAFRQPEAALCPDWNFGDDAFAACGGQGYCNFTRTCICFDNNDCNEGDGFCTNEGVCGCANDGQCGAGQVCSQGECSCADDIACAVGEVCLDGGSCSCSTAEDCGEGLICSNGACSAITEGLTSFSFIDNADPTELPRTIEQSIELPVDLEDSEALALTVEVFDYNEPPPSIVATQTISFKLDRAFPLLNTVDDCENDNDCAVAGESCDLITNRCYPEAEANIGTCRPLDDFSQGLSADYIINDNYDDNPSFTLLEASENGCQQLQKMLLVDNCGNAQVVEAEGIRPPNQGEVNLSLEGYICNSIPCARDQVISDGESGSRVNVSTTLESPERCFDYVETILDTLDENGLVISSRPLFSDEVLQALPATLLSSREVQDSNGSFRIAHGGPFQLTSGEELIITLANGTTETFTISEEDFFDLDTVPAIEVVIAMNRQTTEVYASLDGNDLRLKTRQLGEGVSLDVAGDAASSLGFTAAFDSASSVGSGDGDFRARTDAYACGNEVPLVSDNFNFTVSMPFEISIGGPYNVDEGEELNISAENVFVSEGFGGIAKVEWDTDGDGVYELEERFLFPAEILSTRDNNGEIIHGGPFSLSAGEGLIFTYADGSNESFTVLSQDYADFDEQSGLITASTAEVILAISRQVSGVIGSTESDGDLLISTVVGGLGVTLTVSGDAAVSLGFTSAQSSDFATGSGEVVNQLPEEPVDDPETSETMLTVVSIDTEDQKEHLVSLRVTTGQGETLETRAPVNVNDVSPVCVLPQETYNLREGEVFNFTAPETVAGGEADLISVYRWSFGDGSPDAENANSSTQHIYEEEGEYTLTLTAIDEDSACPQDAVALVVVGGVAPILEGVELVTDVSEVIEGEPISFTSGQTRAGAGSDPIIEYSWDFGYAVNGERVVSIGPDVTAPIHTYDNDGDYDVCLSVSDSDDQVGPTCFSITVQDLSPNPTWNANTLQASEGDPITFDWTGTVAGGVADPLTGVRWSFSDGSEPVNSDLDTPEIVHTFDGDGEFTVRLTALDEDSEAFYEAQVTILDVSPTARFEFILPPNENNAQEGVPLTLDASTSAPGANSDPIESYRWDFGDGSPVRDSNGPTITHAWPDGPGTYEVQCTAIDSDGSTSTSSLVINVSNVDPEVSISGPDNVEVGSEITLNVNVEDVAADFPGAPESGATVEWDMGDGTILTGASVNHSFQSEGTFNVSVRFFDGDGGEAEASYRVTVTAQLAELTNVSVSVERGQEGGVVDDPQRPIGEFIDDEVNEGTYYLREGDHVTLSVTINSARLANGILNPASFNWQVPEGALIEDLAVQPPEGEEGAGSEVTQSSVHWRPNFFAAGEYSLLLSVNGESGGTFNRIWTFKVAERGTPMLATTSGSLRNGRVILYEYDLNNNSLGFTPNREVIVGRGAYDILADDDRQRLFVSSPLSGHVAVLGGDPLSLVRRISTGAGAYDMSWGGGRLWVINTEANTLTAIDPQTLKVERTLDLTGIERPLALAYMANESISPRLFVGCGTTGKLLVINAQDMLAGLGDNAIEYTIDLAGSITQLAQRDDRFWAVDGKLRRLYEGSITTIAQTGNAAALSQIDGIPFAASDITPTARGLWVATGDQLSLIDPDGFIEDYDVSVDVMVEANPILFPNGQNGLVLSNGERIEHKLIENNGDLTDSIGLNGSRLQKMANYIQYLDQ